MSRWDRRIERAAELELQYPAAAELLRFYRLIAQFQKEAARDSRTGDSLAIRAKPLLRLLERSAPPPLAGAARLMAQTRDWDPADPATRFVFRVLAQASADGRASLAWTGQEAYPPKHCGERPVCAALRPEGDGGKRFLVCSICFAEWEFNRIRCPSCGEENHQKLPVYAAEQFPHVRVEACDACHTYLKSIDLTKNGLAVPEVDELAAVALDVWAAEHGYVKLQANLLGL
jgi:FdhE protein